MTTRLLQTGFGGTPQESQTEFPKGLSRPGNAKSLPSDSALVEFSVPKISRFLYMLGHSLSLSPDKAAQNPRISSFWRDKPERKEKYFNFTQRGKIYQIAVKSGVT